MTNPDGLKRVPRQELSYERDARYHHEGAWFSGWAISVHPRAREEQEFRDGFRWGPARTYDAHGKLIQEANFRMDLMHGVESEWNDDGALIREATYEHGLMLEEREWDDAGNLVKDFKRTDAEPHLEEMRRLYGTPEQVAEEEAAYRARQG